MGKVGTDVAAIGVKYFNVAKPVPSSAWPRVVAPLARELTQAGFWVLNASHISHKVELLCQSLRTGSLIATILDLVNTLTVV